MALSRPANSPRFPFSSNLPARASNLPGNTYQGLFQNFFINFVIFETSKRKIKQEVDLVLLFELLSIRKYKTENQINIYLMSIVIGQKSTNQIAQYMAESWRGFLTPSSTSGTFKRSSGVILGEYSDIVDNDILTMQKFLDVSRFLYSGGGQVCY